MIKEIAENPLLIGVGIAAAVAIGNWLTSVFTRRKVQADLETIRLQAQVVELERARVHALELEHAKTVLAQEQQVIADTLAQTNKEHADAALAMSKKLDEIAIVAEKTHIQTNSARTAMERVEQELRSQLKAQELAASTAAAAAVTAMQAVRDLAAKDLQLEREVVAHLTQQLAAATPPVPAVPRPPVPDPASAM